MENESENGRVVQGVRPIRIFRALLYLNAFLLLLVLIFRGGEWVLGSGLKLRFVSWSELVEPVRLRVVDMDSVLRDIHPTDSTVRASLYLEDTLIPMPEIARRIQYPEQGNRVPLEAFFRALWKLDQKGVPVIRVAHFGDSQLEGDRISDYLRNKLQRRFGGHGPGIVLPMDISNARRSVLQSESADWKKYAVYGQNRRLKNGYYGIGASSYRFDGKFSAKIGEDTLIGYRFTGIDSFFTSMDSALRIPGADSLVLLRDTMYLPLYEERTVEQTYLRFRNATRSYPRLSTFSSVKLLYGAEQAFRLQIEVDDSVRNVVLPSAEPVQMAELYGAPVKKGVRLYFQADPSPYIYGVMMDGDSGIALDNFAMRGSSGLGFDQINPELFSRMMELTNTKLILMQYGVNVVPNPVKNYRYYERMFDAQLKAIRKAAPNTSIVVIGPSDMSRKLGRDFVSYPNIPLIRDAMKNAAFANSCAFWDLYEAMGGENSMVAWVQNNPPLAAKDFTHFSSKGAQFIGEMLYNALIFEYTQWKKQRASEATKVSLEK